MTPALFEGPEKKFELAVVDGHGSLRALGDDFWAGVVAAAQATILHKLSSARVDAYLLSESSLLVHDDHVTMITCGRTRLADAVETLVSRLGVGQVAQLVYERKNEHFPEDQATTFHEDARRIHRLLPGRAHRFGDQHEHRVHIFCTEAPFTPKASDTTLEILMHGIDPERTRRFAARPAAGTLAAAAGLEALLPGFTVDEHLFEPEGYSLNALRGSDYYTVHVTPQRVGSYVSFETNLLDAAVGDLTRGVVEVFGPDSFDVVTFVPGGSRRFPLDAPGYHLRKHVDDVVGGYGVTFRYFYRPPTSPASAVGIDLS